MKAHYHVETGKRERDAPRLAILVVRNKAKARREALSAARTYADAAVGDLWGKEGRYEVDDAHLGRVFEVVECTKARCRIRARE